MSSSGFVRFSQEDLYYPLPLTSSVENVVELRNLLQVGEDRCENVVAFKVFCTVRNRYGVKPPSGLIFPSESVRIAFMLDVNKLRCSLPSSCVESGAVVALPDKTRDEMFVDIDVVPRDLVAKYLALSGGSGGYQTVRGRANVDAASAFWALRGRLRPKEPNAFRRVLRCIYAKKPVPDSLVVKRTVEAVEKAARLKGLLSSTADAAASPAARDLTVGDGNRSAPSPPVVSTVQARKGTEEHRSYLQRSTTTSSADSLQNIVTVSAISTAKGESSGARSLGQDDKELETVSNMFFIKMFFLYRLSLPVFCMLIALSFSCGILERETFLLGWWI